MVPIYNLIMTEQDKTDLQSVERLLKEGRKQEALSLLAGYLQQNPNSAQGWWLLGLTVSDPARQIECMERVLLIDPASVLAQVRLEKLREEVSIPPPIPPFVEPISFEEPEVSSPQLPKQDPKPPAAQKNIPISKTKNSVFQYVVISVLAFVVLVVLGFAVMMFLQNAPNQSVPILFFVKTPMSIL